MSGVLWENNQKTHSKHFFPFRDVGIMHPDGKFHIKGRDRDELRLCVRRSKRWPSAIENTVSTHFKIAEIKVKASVSIVVKVCNLKCFTHFVVVDFVVVFQTDKSNQGYSQICLEVAIHLTKQCNNN